jgi:hypothetical protein
MRRRNLDRKRRADLSTATNETGEVDLNQVIKAGCLRKAGTESKSSCSGSIER